MNNKIKVILADDHPILVHGLISILAQRENIEVLGHSHDGLSAFNLIKESNPDIAILDVQMPELDGFKVTQRVLSEGLSTKIILLTMFNEESFVKKVFDIGVKGYILKDNAVTDIVNCIETVARGGIYLSPKVSELLLKKKDKPSANEDEILTPAETNILRLISEDKSTKTIATELFLSIKTVENHRSNICKKLGITGNSALLKYAMRLKM